MLNLFADASSVADGLLSNHHRVQRQGYGSCILYRIIRKESQFRSMHVHIHWRNTKSDRLANDWVSVNVPKQGSELKIIKLIPA